MGTLFATITSVKISSDGNMPGISCQLTYMIYMVCQLFQPARHIQWSRCAPNPIRNYHPGITCCTYHCFSLDKDPYLFIIELPVMWYKRSAIIVTGPNRSLV